jgi:hypothetical protein
MTNPSTNYQNGVDWHLDWGASQFLTKQIFVGAVGYFYEQLSPDRGCAPQLCPFESGVIGGRPAGRFHFSGRPVASLFKFEGIWGVRCAQPAIGMEWMGDAVIFTACAHQSEIRNAYEAMM